jgi:Predicted membrane protein
MATKAGKKIAIVVLAALAALAVLNIISFSLMAYDKRCARQGKWRVPEWRLFLATACFGGLGGVLGMQMLRHKTKHWYFVWGVPAILIAEVALAVWWLCKYL